MKLFTTDGRRTDGRTTDGRRIHGYPISSPMSQGSGELKTDQSLFSNTPNKPRCEKTGLRGSLNMARGMKFHIQKVEGLYYPCSENKGADQLCGYREADLRLCFRIYKNPVFS